MAVLISESVGRGGANRSADVRKIKRLFKDLGFEFFPMNGSADQGLIMTIRLFQAIIVGRSTVGGGDGRVDPNGRTLAFMNASNAPRWRTMPLAGTGFINHEAQQLNDHHDFGTSWLADTLIAAGADYHRRFLEQRPDRAPLSINDVSLPRGGDTPDHAGHETGLVVDIRLPRLNGGSGGIGNPNTNSQYDRAAMRAQLRSLKAQPMFHRALFNDNKLVQEGLCKRASGHNNHAHIEIKPPTLIAKTAL